MKLQQRQRSFLHVLSSSLFVSCSCESCCYNCYYSTTTARVHFLCALLLLARFQPSLPKSVSVAQTSSFSPPLFLLLLLCILLLLLLVLPPRRRCWFPTRISPFSTKSTPYYAPASLFSSISRTLSATFYSASPCTSF